MRKSAHNENLLMQERKNFDEALKKNEELQENLLGLQAMKNEFSQQLVQVNKFMNELKAQLVEIQEEKNVIENKKNDLEEKIKEINETSMEQEKAQGRKYDDLIKENKMLLEKIEDLQRDYELIQNEQNKSLVNNKAAEKKVHELKLNSQKKEEQIFLEYQLEKEKNRKNYQKTFEEYEHLKADYEIINRKNSKLVQDATFLLLQIDNLKEELNNERNFSDDIKKNSQESLEQLKEYEQQNINLKETIKILKINYKKNNEKIGKIVKEAFNQVNLAIYEFKEQYNAQIHNFQKYCHLKNNEISDFIHKNFINLSLFASGLQKECKKLKENISQNEKSIIQLKNLTENLKYELGTKDQDIEKSEKTIKTIGQKYENLEKNQNDLHLLIKMKETEIFSLKQQQEKTVNENELLYHDKKDLNDYYRNILTQLCAHISYIEENQLKEYDELYNNILNLKNSTKADVEEIYQKNQEILQYKDCIIGTKEKNGEYYKEVCANLEKESKKIEDAYLERIKKLEKELKDSKQKIKIIEKEAVQKKSIDSEEALRYNYEFRTTH